MLNGIEEAKAILEQEIDDFIEELKETYDDEIVEEVLARRYARSEFSDEVIKLVESAKNLEEAIE